MNVIRPWRFGDLPSLVGNANNRNVWRNLRDRFPHPYGVAGGQAWLERVATLNPLTELAIQRDGAAVGGVGVTVGQEVERVSGEIGYWLGEAHWGRGLATEAVREFTTYAFNILPLERVFAVAFARNVVSIAVLMKIGFRREGQLVDSAIKDGRLESQAIYAVTRSEWKG